MSKDKKKRYRSIFISDVHLGTRHSNAEKLLDFLKQSEAERYYLVGDIIDGIASIDAPYAEIPHTGLAQAVFSLNYGDKPSLVEEANVHLIVAAPDMYDCLCLVRQLFVRRIIKGEKLKKKHMLVCIEDIDLVLAHAREIGRAHV